MHGSCTAPRLDALLCLHVGARPGASGRGVRLREAPGFRRGEMSPREMCGARSTSVAALAAHGATGHAPVWASLHVYACRRDGGESLLQVDSAFDLLTTAWFHSLL